VLKSCPTVRFVLPCLPLIYRPGEYLRVANFCSHPTGSSGRFWSNRIVRRATIPNSFLIVQVALAAFGHLLLPFVHRPTLASAQQVAPRRSVVRPWKWRQAVWRYAPLDRSHGWPRVRFRLRFRLWIVLPQRLVRFASFLETGCLIVDARYCRPNYEIDLRLDRLHSMGRHHSYSLPHLPTVRARQEVAFAVHQSGFGLSLNDQKASLVAARSGAPAALYACLVGSSYKLGGEGQGGSSNAIEIAGRILRLLRAVLHVCTGLSVRVNALRGGPNKYGEQPRRRSRYQ
jgi:hypothetical protein